MFQPPTEQTEEDAQELYPPMNQLPNIASLSSIQPGSIQGGLDELQPPSLLPGNTSSQHSLLPAEGTNDSGVKTIVLDGRRLVVVGDDG